MFRRQRRQSCLRECSLPSQRRYNEYHFDTLQSLQGELSVSGWDCVPYRFRERYLNQGVHLFLDVIPSPLHKTWPVLRDLAVPFIDVFGWQGAHCTCTQSSTYYHFVDFTLIVIGISLNTLIPSDYCPDIGLALSIHLKACTCPCPLSSSSSPLTFA